MSSRFIFSFIAMIVLLFSQITLAQTAPAATKARGNAFNPDIGLNLLTLYQNSNRGNQKYDEERNGFSIQEAELQFSADVDPYWRLMSVLALHQEVEVDDTTAPPTRTAEYVLEPEEASAESTGLPYVNLKVGKFKAAMGKQNQIHTHAYAFIDAPLTSQVLLGDEGLNDVGVSASALLPTSWFSEFTFQILSGQGEGLDYFQSGSSNSNVFLANYKNLWDLTENSTFEIGLSAATGDNQANKTTNLYALDFTFKSRQSAAKAFIFSTEVMQRQQEGVTDESATGIASWAQYQFAKQWWVQARAEYLDVDDQDPAALKPLPDQQKKQSFLIGFVPSEFSAVRLQYDHLDDQGTDEENRVLLQLNYSIGAHPAHAY